MRNFFRCFLTEFKRRIFSLGFFAMLVISAASWLFSSLDDLQHIDRGSVDVLQCWDMAQNLGYFTPLVVLCCTALNCTAFLNDFHSAFYRGCVIRSGKIKYLVSKYLSCVLSGGLTAALGLVVYILILSAKYPLVRDNSGILESYLMSTAQCFVREILSEGHYIGFFAVIVFLLFLFGALWSGAGLALSAFISDRYVASFAPFIIYSASKSIIPSKFETTIIICGDYNVGGVWGSILFAVIYFGIVTAVFGIAFCIKAKARCES